MKSLTAAENAALAARNLAFRNLIWMTAKTRAATPVPVAMGFWDDVGTRSIQVIDALTGAAVTRSFVGAGSLIQVDDVVAAAALDVRELVIRLSGIDASVAQAVRGYDARLAPIQVYRVLLNPVSGTAIAAARPRFVGIVDTLRIRDPARGGQGGIEISAVSQMRELTRANPDMTSDDSQKDRAAALATPLVDRFYEHANSVVGWTIAWGALSLKAQRKQAKKDRD